MTSDGKLRGLFIAHILLSLVILIVAIVCAISLKRHLNEEEEVTGLFSIEDYRKSAEKSIPRSSWLVIHDGAVNQHTITENEAAFRRIKIMPKALVDVSGFSSELTVFDQNVSMPIAIAPVAYLRMVHPEGDAMLARAASAQNVIYGQSAHSSSSIEEVASMAPASFRWQQVYLYNNFSLSLQLVHRAEKNGAKAIIVTVDKPVKTIRYNFVNGKATVPRHVVKKSFEMYGDRKWAKRNWVTTQQTWRKLAELTGETSLPVVVKGILNADDVINCAGAGARGVIVSNHGGRTLDEVPASISVLREVAIQAKRHGLEVFMDGGVRSGLDVFKALALGAKMVFIGRPAFWGLASNGQEGAEDVLRIFQKEFENTAQMAGAQSIAGIDDSFIYSN